MSLKVQEPTGALPASRMPLDLLMLAAVSMSGRCRSVCVLPHSWVCPQGLPA